MGTSSGIRVLVALFLVCGGMPSAFAQNRPSPGDGDGWQGPRPTPQRPLPLPAPQRATPPGKQVLEIPSRPQPVLEPPRQQAVIPPRPQAEVPTRPQREAPRPTQLVTATVTDQHGRYVTGLGRSDFDLYEDGERQEITYFNTGDNEPVSMGLVVDTSGSMRGKMEQARHALSRFIDVIRPEDEVFVEEFNTQPRLLQDFTDSRRLLAQAVGALRPAGSTALYDAMLDGLRRVKRGRHQKRALIVISDGVDMSSLSSLDQVVRAAKRSGVLIYAIGIGSPNDGGFHPGGGGGIRIGPFVLGGGAGGGGFGGDELDTRTLRTASDDTGGKLFVLNTADVFGSADVLEAATRTISRELRSQYSLGYTPSRSGSQYRDVRVEARRADAGQLEVRAQRGYAKD